MSPKKQLLQTKLSFSRSTSSSSDSQGQGSVKRKHSDETSGPPFKMSSEERTVTFKGTGEEAEQAANFKVEVQAPPVHYPPQLDIDSEQAGPSKSTSSVVTSSLVTSSVLNEKDEKEEKTTYESANSPDLYASSVPEEEEEEEINGNVSDGSHEHESKMEYGEETLEMPPDSEEPVASSSSSSAAEGTNSRNYWGCPMNELPQAPGCYDETSRLTSLQCKNEHRVFFIPNAELQNAVKPPNLLSQEFSDDWANVNEVKMPCSKGNQIPDPNSKTYPPGTICRWELIEKALKQNIPGSFELAEAILSYNKHYKSQWNFDALHSYFNEHCSRAESDTFFSSTLPKIQKLANSLPHFFNKSIPFLKQGMDSKVTFSQQQVACLLANAFFCTFPKRNHPKTRGSICPNINFSSLFQGSSKRSKSHKIKCIVHYFERVTTEVPTGVVTYERRVLSENVEWAFSKAKLSKLHMSPQGRIEEDGRHMLQADFANKNVGGGVLGHGCVQEEIRFLICPEMILSRLFTETLTDSEVLVMTGCERFSNYTGYADSFKWDSDHQDTIQRDEWGRRYTEVVAMDALHIRKNMDQFSESCLKRELNKAYNSFREMSRGDHPAAVCTGNWGCGAFGGDNELKALIQIMAASQAQRDVCYMTFGDKQLCRRVTKIHRFWVEEDLTVGDLFDTITDFSYKQSGPFISLLDFIMKNCCS